jgi:hypothetical protein
MFRNLCDRQGLRVLDRRVIFGLRVYLGGAASTARGEGQAQNSKKDDYYKGLP